MELTADKKQQIIKICKQHIKEHDNVRVGWAAEQVFQVSMGKVDNHILSKIEAAMTKSGKYRSIESRKHQYDWDIRLSPSYSWTIITRIFAITAFVLSLINIVMLFLRK